MLYIIVIIIITSLEYNETDDTSENGPSELLSNYSLIKQGDWLKIINFWTIIYHDEKLENLNFYNFVICIRIEKQNLHKHDRINSLPHFSINPPH